MLSQLTFLVCERELLKQYVLGWRNAWIFAKKVVLCTNQSEETMELRICWKRCVSEGYLACVLIRFVRQADVLNKNPSKLSTVFTNSRFSIPSFSIFFLLQFSDENSSVCSNNICCHNCFSCLGTWIAKATYVGLKKGVNFCQESCFVYQLKWGNNGVAKLWKKMLHRGVPGVCPYSFCPAVQVWLINTHNANPQC